MTTALVKPIRRRIRVRVPHGINPELIITLYPGGIIGLREARRRREYQVDAGILYTIAASRPNTKKEHSP